MKRYRINRIHSLCDSVALECVLLLPTGVEAKFLEILDGDTSLDRSQGQSCSIVKKLDNSRLVFEGRLALQPQRGRYCPIFGNGYIVDARPSSCRRDDNPTDDVSIATTSAEIGRRQVHPKGLSWQLERLFGRGTSSINRLILLLRSLCVPNFEIPVPASRNHEVPTPSARSQGHRAEARYSALFVAGPSAVVTDDARCAGIDIEFADRTVHSSGINDLQIGSRSGRQREEGTSLHRTLRYQLGIVFVGFMNTN
mmetsp:Transcript_666/g.1605  ORF Transcript_666/g.1605 Transcript_666/m.1605 type:complete len:254 (+) Transcript_666:269-1030(+)